MLIKKFNILFLIVAITCFLISFDSFSHSLDDHNHDTDKIQQPIGGDKPKTNFNLDNLTNGYSEKDFHKYNVSRFKLTLKFNYEDLVLECGVSIAFEDCSVTRDYQLVQEKQYYYTKNKQNIESLELIGSYNITISSYSPFAIIVFDKDKDYLLNVRNIKNLDSNSSISSIYIENNDRIIQYADRNTSDGDDYPFSSALSDTGVSGTYTGSGINVGVIDIGVPDSYDNFPIGTYELFSTITQDNHATKVASVLGGTYGVAPDSKLFFASIIDNNQIDIFDWFYDNDVHVANMSIGHSTGVYSSNSELLDYYSVKKRITFVVSAGNINSVYHLVNDLSMADNAISVGSISINGNVAVHSSYEKETGYEVYNKPTIIAPGDGIIGIPNISSPLFGTSYSSPFVAGIVARLFQEFETLMYNPSRVISLLTSSAVFVNGQYDVFDQDAGAGLINYTNARQLESNTKSFESSSQIMNGTILVSHTFYSSGNKHLKVIASLLRGMGTDSNEGNTSTNSYILRVIRVSDGATISEISNNSYHALVYLNFSFNAGANQQYTIRLIQQGNGPTNFVFMGAFTYTEHTPVYTHRYVDNGNNHKSYCFCGEYILGYHIGDSSQAGQRYVDCVKCGASVDTFTTPIIFPAKTPLDTLEHDCLDCNTN